MRTVTIARDLAPMRDRVSMRVGKLLLALLPTADALRLAACRHARADTIRMLVPPPLPAGTPPLLVTALNVAADASDGESATHGPALFPGVGGLPSTQLLAGPFGGGAPPPPSPPPTAAGKALDLVEQGLGVVGAKTAEFVRDERTQVMDAAQ